MRSSSSALPVRTGVVDGVVFSRWALADLTAHAGGRASSRRTAEDAAELARAEEAAREPARGRGARAEQERGRGRRGRRGSRAETQEEPRARGVRAGPEEGRRKGEIAEGARLRTAVTAAEEALDEIRESEIRWTGTIEENICALAVAVARHVIGRELKEEVEPVLELVRDALVEFPIDQPIRIRLNPADLLAVRSSTAARSRATRWRHATATPAGSPTRTSPRAAAWWRGASGSSTGAWTPRSSASTAG